MSQAYPVLESVPLLKEYLSAHNIAILQAPPGAGKSTVLPLELLDEPWLKGRKIIMLEPRRLAARTVAHRMASVREDTIGKTVGYRIRFETRVSEDTRIEVVTEGILTRMIQTDNTLERVGMIIFDEFHERSLQADLALALSLQVQKIIRDDLRILIMSATLDGDALSAKLNAPIVTTTGRQFPVEIRYDNFDPNGPIANRMARMIRKALNEETGDVLAFLPGAGEIARTQALLESENVPASLCALYGDLSMKKQQEAIMPLPEGRRKVVLSTSIAETSLTIEGIRIVIDSGMARVPRFDPRNGLTRLDTIRVTKDAADQRAGRAGRLGPGICYRLWSEGANAGLVAHRTPEILEADLAPLLLELSQWGVQEVQSLLWMTNPPAGAISQARELLEQLDALEGNAITERGRRMLQLPTHPRIAHMLLSVGPASNSRQLTLACDVAALLEERDPLPRDSGADLTLRLEVLRRWRKGEKTAADRNSLERIERLSESWRKIFAQRPDNEPVGDEEVGKLLAAAYPERIARQVEKNSDRYKLANGRVVKLPSHDPLTREPWLSVAHLDGGGDGKIFLAAPLNEDDLAHLATEHEVIRWDKERGLVTGSIDRRIGNLVLESKALPVIPAQKRIQVLCDAIRDEGLSAIGWTDEQIAWQARVMSLRAWRPDEGWPDVSDSALLDSLVDWLTPYLDNVFRRTELLRLPIASITSGILSWELSTRLDLLAPAKLEVPTGSRIPVQYFVHGQLPIMEVRLQEVFGLLETPVVNDGRTRVIMHLLSPGYKPVQVTQDLRSFWQTAYHKVRKELRIRYRKHSWPEDPWTATAVRGAKKKGG